MSEADRASVAHLTIYLAKHDRKIVSALLRQQQTVTCEDVKVPDVTSAKLVVQQREAQSPKWARLFAHLVERAKFGTIRSAAAALFIELDDRLFALTFGQGRHLLATDAFEEQFGLRVTLNSIRDNSVRSIDKKTFDSVALHTREQASREASTGDFGLDLDRDLVRAVTGVPEDECLGRRMSGMDALNVAVPATAETLGQLLRAYRKKFEDTSYRERFPGIDQIAEVSDPSLRTDLDGVLLERIGRHDTADIWMATPEIVPWDRVSGFQYGRGSQHPEHYDINLVDYLAETARDGVPTRSTFARDVICIDPDGTAIDKWRGYQCLYAELDRDEQSYVLSGGRWYRVQRDFVEQVNAAFDEIETAENLLPPYSDRNEGDYNRRVAASDDSLALMDKVLVPHGGGRSKIEFCDLFSATHDIIHVKRYGNAGALSHLFSQAMVSGELWRSDARFREQVNGRLPPSHQLEDPRQPLADGRYRAVFAVISDAEGGLRLPFFSRVNMKHAATRLKSYGYRVAKTKISVASGCGHRRGA